MWRMFNRASIRAKLLVTVVLASGVSGLLIGVILIGHYLVTLTQTTIRETAVQADIVGSGCAEALTLQDASRASKTLRQLSAVPRIEAAYLYTPGGQTLAEYRRNPAIPFIPPASSGEAYRLEGGYLHQYRNVSVNGRAVGVLYLLTRMPTGLDLFLETAPNVGLILVAIALIIWWISRHLHQIISIPVRNLLSTIDQVTQERNYAIRAVKRNEDELGDLTDGFNQMLAQIQRQETALQQAQNDLERKVRERTEAAELEIQERRRAEQELEQVHRQLLDISREIGMAEVATGVLHNVGNVLNSVNVSANLIGDRVRNTSASATGLSRAAGLLNEHNHDLEAFLVNDGKGRMLPNYLSGLAEQLTEDQQRIQDEVQALTQNVAHVRNIVSAQQQYATAPGILERIEVPELIDYALELAGGTVTRGDIEIVRSYEDVPPVETEKHKVIQILVNLFRNASEAMQDARTDVRRLSLSIQRKGRRHVAIIVSDTGAGIPRENLTRIFSHGFTTKPHGHGFGLHSAALVAKQLKAELLVDSDGPGQGATFTLTLPV